MNFDITIIGAGIVGLATGYNLLESNPELKVCILEKENSIAKHQTGNNSGVIHSGIYYKPRSKKAANCKEGYQLLIDFCKSHGVPYELCGKVIVATEENEISLLENIFQRGIENNLEGLRYLNEQELKQKEPNVAGIKGIWVPQAGIVDYTEVSKQYAVGITKAGGIIKLDHVVVGIKKKGGTVFVKTSNGTIQTKLLVNCAGLYSDKIARMTGQEIDFKILPFRGEYYELKPHKVNLVNGLIYPVPNPDFPFLGVHFTKMIKGGVEAGPNAVLAFAREGYRKRDINLSELLETITYPGFLKIAAKYWKDGTYEMYRSFSKAAFVNALQKLIPTIKSNDIIAGGAGVRAQACYRNGQLIDDFLILKGNQTINVCNAPSPAATSSLAIGASISKEIMNTLI